MAPAARTTHSSPGCTTKPRVVHCKRQKRLAACASRGERTTRAKRVVEVGRVDLRALSSRACAQSHWSPTRAPACGTATRPRRTRHRAPNICCDKRLAQGCVFEPQAVAPEEQSSVTRIDGAGLAAHTSKRPFETTRTRRAHRVPRWLRLEGGTSHALQTDEGQHREDFKHNCGGFDQRREWHR